MNPDVVVVGGGLVGSAIAYGLAGHKLRVMLLDGGDHDFRASTGNAGLVWLQGKGMDMPNYQQLTRTSVKDLWPSFSADLTDTTTIDLEYERRGGLSICMSPQEFESRHSLLTRWHEQGGSLERDWEMLERSELRSLLPKVAFGSNVVGASFGYHDGQVNPLRLLRALHTGLLRKGGQLCTGCTVHSLTSNRDGGFTIASSSSRISADRVVIAAGLGSKALMRSMDLDVPIRPQRGQILITERVEATLPLPLQHISQTRQGTLSIGSTSEENVGRDVSTTIDAAAAMSARAIRWIPALQNIRVVRQWAALRIMTPDGGPIYAELTDHPGMFLTVCHSGVTLAAVHAILIAKFIASDRLPSLLEQFHYRRFCVPKTEDRLAPGSNLH